MKIHLDSTRVQRLLSAGIAASALAFFPSLAHAELLSSWTQYSGSVSSDLNTASPILGNGTSESADSQTIYAVSSSSYTLAVGDTITLSGGVTFTNLTSPQSDQFRFGLYNTNSQTGATGWLGYFATNSGTSAGPTYSRLWELPNPNSHTLFNESSGTTQIATANASPSNTAFASGSYTFALTATRTVAGLDLTWSLIGTDVTYSVSKTVSDTTPQTYAFNGAGFFTGGGLNASQVSFSNVDLTYTSAAIPEPAAFALVLGAAAGILMLVRRRQRRAA